MSSTTESLPSSPSTGDTSATNSSATDQDDEASAEPVYTGSDRLALRLQSLQTTLLALAAARDNADSERLARRASVTVRRLYASSWRAVARGELDYPGRLLEGLRRFGGLADQLSPGMSNKDQAACLLRTIMDLLFLADKALSKTRSEARLANRERTATEREILRVLAENSTYLRRGQIYELISSKIRPSRARISQILDQLASDDLLIRIFAKARGNPRTAHYSLSTLGHELWTRLQRKPTLDRVAFVEKLMPQLKALDQSLNSAGNLRIVLGLIASQKSNPAVADLASAIQEAGDTIDARSADIVLNVVKARLETEKVVVQDNPGSSHVQSSARWHEVASTLREPPTPSTPDCEAPSGLVPSTTPRLQTDLRSVFQKQGLVSA